MGTSHTRAALPALGAAVALLAGCGGVSELTKERVARTETSVQQAQDTLGNSEAGALEMQRARDHLDQAHRAVNEGEDEQAQRHASLAELDAELAVARAQSTTARRAADELIASIKTLRREAGLSESEASGEALQPQEPNQ